MPRTLRSSDQLETTPDVGLKTRTRGSRQMSAAERERQDALDRECRRGTLLELWGYDRPA